MPNSAMVDKLLLESHELDKAKLHRATDEALHGLDDGEMFMEYRLSEGINFDDGHLKSASYDTCQGFGLRALAGQSTGFAHSSELSMDAIRRASAAVQAIKAGHKGEKDLAPRRTNQALYDDTNPLESPEFDTKIQLLAEIDAYARSKDSRVRQVSVSLLGEWQAVKIFRTDGIEINDVRPLVRLNISVVASDGKRLESGSHGVGSRVGYAPFINPTAWQSQADEALRQALINLESVPAPAGETTVVLGPGWPGILLHEAIGHGLEGDFNRKKTSAFSGLLGEKVANPGVTVVDDGTLPKRRGSISIDDEGTPTERTVLIENGILTGYLQDRLNARLMGMRPTGNGRRQSYQHAPMPRMTNTFMLAGDQAPDEIISNVSSGLYAVNFGGGQVDITSGKFVFSCTEAYLISDGKLGPPVKGATLIGNGPDVLTKVSAVGTDMQLDPGVGTCGKNGQGVPVGVGLPTICVDSLTVGGTENDVT